MGTGDSETNDAKHKDDVEYSKDASIFRGFGNTLWAGACTWVGCCTERDDSDLSSRFIGCGGEYPSEKQRGQE